MTKTILLSIIGALFLGAIVFFGYRARTFTPAAAICTLGNCPQQLYVYDSGEQVLYRVGDRFLVVLDQRTNPQEHLQCAPGGILGLVDIATRSATYTARLEAKAKGTCVLSSDHFTVKVTVQ